jgi:hypothetical protein
MAEILEKLEMFCLMGFIVPIIFRVTREVTSLNLCVRLLILRESNSLSCELNLCDNTGSDLIKGLLSSMCSLFKLASGV